MGFSGVGNLGLPGVSGNLSGLLTARHADPVAGLPASNSNGRASAYFARSPAGFASRVAEQPYFDAEALVSKLAMRRRVLQLLLLKASNAQHIANASDHLSASQTGAGIASVPQAASVTYAQTLAAQYASFFAGHPLHLNWLSGYHHGFASRRQTALRVLSRFFGLEGDALKDAEVSLLQGVSGGGDSAFSDGEDSDADNSNAGDGHPEDPSASIRNYLIAEVALSDASLTSEQRVAAAGLRQRLFADEAQSIQAGIALAEIAVEFESRSDGSVMPGSSNSALPGSAPVSEGKLAGLSLNDLCHQLLQLYSPDRLLNSMGTLINSLDLTSQRRAFHGDGIALSECLSKMRNLSVIHLIMKDMEDLKSRMLFNFNTGKLPSDETLWRSVCKLTQVRSIEPILIVLKGCDLTIASKRFFLQGVQTILRSLPLGVWTDPDNRPAILAALSDITGANTTRLAIATQ